MDPPSRPAITKAEVLRKEERKGKERKGKGGEEVDHVQRTNDEIAVP